MGRQRKKTNPELTGVLSLVSLTLLAGFCWVSYNVLMSSDEVTYCYVQGSCDGTYKVSGNVEWGFDRILAQADTGQEAARIKKTLEECK